MDVLIGQFADLCVQAYQGDKPFHIGATLVGGVDFLFQLRGPLYQLPFSKTVMLSHPSKVTAGIAVVHKFPDQGDVVNGGINRPVPVQTSSGGGVIE